MKRQLYYQIAGHLVMIDTPEPEETAALIRPFHPFRVETGEELTLLLRFSGNREIHVPDGEPAEVVDIEGISFKIHHEAGKIIVVMKSKNTEYHMEASTDRKMFYSDLTLTGRVERMYLIYFLRTAFALASATHKTVKLHGSVIEKEGKALVFLGKSGTGKSTHTRLWKEFVPGCSLLNDDEPIVRLMDDGKVRVYGAPWSGSTPCYRNVSADVSAFVHLHQHSENSLTRLNGVKAFVPLFQSAATLRSDRENRALVISMVNDILEKVPVYRLDNRPDREAVSLTETLMA